MRLGASRRNDTDHIASDRVSNNKHSAVDKAESIEAGFARSIAVLEIDDEGIKTPSRPF
jgi:hypothetical protein